MAPIPFKHFVHTQCRLGISVAEAVAAYDDMSCSQHQGFGLPRSVLARRDHQAMPAQDLGSVPECHGLWQLFAEQRATTSGELQGCSLCGKIFQSSTFLVQHMKARHRSEFADWFVSCSAEELAKVEGYKQCNTEETSVKEVARERSDSHGMAHAAGDSIGDTAPQCAATSPRRRGSSVASARRDSRGSRSARSRTPRRSGDTSLSEPSVPVPVAVVAPAEPPAGQASVGCCESARSSPTVASSPQTDSSSPTTDSSSPTTSSCSSSSASQPREPATSGPAVEPRSDAWNRFTAARTASMENSIGFRCSLCYKAFQGRAFVHKHLATKHVVEFEMFWRQL